MELPQPQNYFKKLTAIDEKEKVLKDLVAARGEILCKGTTDNIFKFKAYKMDRDKMRCTIHSESAKFVLSQENVIGTFFLGGEKYFFQGAAIYQNEEVYFNLKFELFLLQRRQNYRVKIPESYKAHIDVQEVNGKKISVKGSLSDISSGGCRAAFRSTLRHQVPLKMDDVLVAQVFVGNRPSIEVTAKVKHIKTDISDKDIQNMGFEFKPLSPQLENRMFAITMDLHRELFNKMNSQ